MAQHWNSAPPSFQRDLKGVEKHGVMKMRFVEDEKNISKANSGKVEGELYSAIHGPWFIE